MNFVRFQRCLLVDQWGGHSLDGRVIFGFSGQVKPASCSQPSVVVCLFFLWTGREQRSSVLGRLDLLRSLRL